MADFFSVSFACKRLASLSRTIREGVGSASEENSVDNEMEKNVEAGSKVCRNLCSWGTIQHITSLMVSMLCVILHLD